MSQLHSRSIRERSNNSMGHFESGVSIRAIMNYTRVQKRSLINYCSDILKGNRCVLESHISSKVRVQSRELLQKNLHFETRIFPKRAISEMNHWDARQRPRIARVSSLSENACLEKWDVCVKVYIYSRSPYHSGVASFTQQFVREECAHIIIPVTILRSFVRRLKRRLLCSSIVSTFDYKRKKRICEIELSSKNLRGAYALVGVCIFLRELCTCPKGNERIIAPSAHGAVSVANSKYV